jgi:hypothetical protein
VLRISGGEGFGGRAAAASGSGDPPRRRRYTRAAGTDTNVRSGYRSAVSLPPNTQPVSMSTVLLSHSGSGTGVWPYTTIARPRYSAAQLCRTGRPNSSVSVTD